VLERPAPSTIPDAPGSYQFKDREGRAVYVGKAKSLRSRLSNYFTSQHLLSERTRQMLAAAETVEWIEVRNEVEALHLEYNLIQKLKPRFNIRLKDDKSFPFLAVTLDEEWPRAMVRRGLKKKGQRWFGPYAHAYAIRETLDLLLRTFPIRTCSNPKFQRHARLGRPCLYAHIEKCTAPCVDAITPADYDALVEELILFLDGEHDPVVRRLEADMRAASDSLEFERAARLRDQLGAVRKVIERQQMVASKEEDFDAIGIADDLLEASVQVFHVRRGRMVGRRGTIVDKVEDVQLPELVSRILEQLYGAEPDVPKEILVPVEPADLDIHELYLTDRRTAAHTGPGRSGAVRVRVPLRGDKKAFLDVVTRNADEELRRHRLRRASDHNARARALLALQEALDLPEAPLRIECYDISHTQGQEIVASMVVMEDGLPNRSQYRRFKIKTLDGQDDFAAMAEVIHRRFTRLLQDRERPVGERGRFAYSPNLVLVDGGRGQLSAALGSLEDLGLAGDIAIASLAKRFEEVYVPGAPEPLRIPRDSEALFLLQQVRDEAHRFAITFHRERRGKAMTRSALDDVPGLGPTRRARLLKELGSLKKVREATLEDLVALPWLPDAVAVSVYERLHADEGRLVPRRPPRSPVPVASVPSPDAPPVIGATVPAAAAPPREIASTHALPPGPMGDDSPPDGQDPPRDRNPEGTSASSAAPTIAP
jgi:excinuclease ABC subunit C